MVALRGGDEVLENLGLLETAPGKRNSSSIAREKDGKVKIVKDKTGSKAVPQREGSKKSEFDEALEFLQKEQAIALLAKELGNDADDEASSLDRTPPLNNLPRTSTMEVTETVDESRTVGVDVEEKMNDRPELAALYGKNNVPELPLSKVAAQVAAGTRKASKDKEHSVSRREGSKESAVSDAVRSQNLYPAKVLCR